MYVRIKNMLNLISGAFLCANVCNGEALEGLQKPPQHWQMQHQESVQS